MKHLVISVAMLMLLSATPVAAKAPKIVTTIQPLHSLVSGVMNGIGAPELLLKGNESPHSFSLKPSTMKLLSNADAIRNCAEYEYGKELSGREYRDIMTPENLDNDHPFIIHFGECEDKFKKYPITFREIFN